MQIVKGIIDVKKSEKRDGWKSAKTSVLLDNGNWYSGFVEVPQEKGEGVALSLVQNGKYLNIKACMAWDGSDMSIPEEFVSDAPTQVPYVKKVSKVQVIQHESWQEWQDKINEFNEKMNVFATQTHIKSIRGEVSTTFLYTAILFFKE
jgi:hypothetical protein